MFQGFIFDVEGTLVDSVPQNLRSLQDALGTSGYRVPIQTLQLYSGLDGDQTLQLAVPEASPDERRAILKDQGSIYERNYLPSVKPFESVRDVFRILTEQGTPRFSACRNGQSRSARLPGRQQGARRRAQVRL
jgi:beta-phosphoglucomutase-like phosphatase (HAD superfamily)